MTSVLVKIDKNKLVRYEIIRATSISFFILLWGIKVGIERKYILHSWVADQSTGFLLARGSYLNVQIAKLGKCVNKNENFNHRNTMNTISSSRMKTKPRQPLIILVFKRIWNVLPLPRETWHGNLRRWINFCPQMFELRIYKVVISIISNWLSVRAQFK